ncbi:MAG: exopolysaccharide biosynthesis polyprenyl glycosylphosphotransferase [Lachnospiraceae bacterium]
MLMILRKHKEVFVFIMGHDLSLRIVKILNALLMAIPFGIVWLLYYSQRTASPFYAKGNWLMIALFLILYISYGRIYEAFQVSLHTISEMVYSQGLAAMMLNLILYVVMWLLTKHLPNILPLILSYGAEIILSVIWCYLANRWYYATFPPKRTAIIYDLRRGMSDLINEYGLTKKFDIVATASVDECLEGQLKVLEGIENVFLCGIHSKERNVILKHCIANDIRVYLLPRIGDVLMSGADKIHMFHLPMLRVSRYNPNPEYLIAKRIFDIVVSACALILTSPIFLITAIAIKISDPGPVFYKQCRLTKDGKEFDILKFRSMRVDAEKDGIARLSSGKNDDRITPIGRLIRRVRIDELPQLVNILRGDMSIVGPRPERPEIAAQYEEEMPEFRLRLQAKAGLTGYAQVYGKYNTTSYDKLQMDLMYLAKPSFVEDLKICFATVKILFMPESTDGVEAGETVAGGKPSFATINGKEVGDQSEGLARRKLRA